jgi:nucleoside-diphosphate-sugar epimerase
LQPPDPELRVLVTGANGFIGGALLTSLEDGGATKVRGAVRGSSAIPAGPSNLVSVGDLAGDPDWRVALSGVDIVVHTAARVHMMDYRPAESLAAFRQVNVDSTLNLARQAANSGVRRFVFLSSIKVNGESTLPDRPFNADDPPMPDGAYALSKHEAETGLQQLGKDTGLQIVIVRPVLVYGPGVRANFLSMMRWIYAGFPLPLGAIRNARSLVALDNLVDLLTTCLYHPAAPNQTFLVSDGEDLSTPELVCRTGAAMGRRVRLMPFPEFVLRSTAAILGKPDLGERLCGSLQVDIGKTRRLLDWSPPVSVDQALRKTARYFLDGNLR